MTTLTPLQVAALWVAHGGTNASAEVAVAIATAESGRRPTAISPDGGYGLFQIQASVWVGPFPVTRQQLLDPNTNTEIAVHIATRGSNFAAWCTMWANPVRDCGHGHITTPQRGSAAARYMGLIQGIVPPTPQQLHPGPEGADVATENTWNQIRDWFGGGATQRWRKIDNATHTVRTKRW